MAETLTGQAKEWAYQETLAVSRRSAVRFVEREVRELAKKIAAKLEKQIRDGNDIVAISILLFLAFLKDGLLDVGLDFLFGFGEIPIIGQLPGYAVSMILYYFMFGKGYFLKQRAKMNMRAWLFVLGFIVDGLPLVNNLPGTTVTVIHTIRLLKKRARKAKADLAALNTSTKAQLESLQKELDGD
ncbi:MAG: hypothetical protein AAB417_01865 [Patescibacteria group bacterium]